jgi:hypothetical protein
MSGRYEEEHAMNKYTYKIKEEIQKCKGIRA